MQMPGRMEIRTVTVIGPAPASSRPNDPQSSRHGRRGEEPKPRCMELRTPWLAKIAGGTVAAVNAFDNPTRVNHQSVVPVDLPSGSASQWSWVSKDRQSNAIRSEILLDGHVSRWHQRDSRLWKHGSRRADLIERHVVSEDLGDGLRRVRHRLKLPELLIGFPSLEIVHPARLDGIGGDDEVQASRRGPGPANEIHITCDTVVAMFRR